MLGAFQAQINKLLGPSQDPLGLITPDQLKAVLKSIEGKYNALRDENKRLKVTISDLKEVTERLEDEGKRYRALAEKEAARPASDPDELVRQRSEVAIVHQAAESLRAELEKSQAASDALRAELAEAQAAGDALRKELERSEAAGESLRYEFDKAQAAGDTLRAELAKSQAACDAWRIELHDVRSDSSRLMDELGEATLNLEAAKGELAETRSALEAARQALETERSTASEREAELAAFQTRAVSPIAHQLIVRERDQLRAEKAELETRIKEHAAAVEALRTELDHARHNTQVVVATTDIKIQERMAALEQEKVALRNQLEAAHAESGRVRRELHGAVGSAFKPQESSIPQRPVSAEERRRLISQLVSGKNP